MKDKPSAEGQEDDAQTTDVAATMVGAPNKASRANKQRYSTHGS